MRVAPGRSAGGALGRLLALSILAACAGTAPDAKPALAGAVFDTLPGGIVRVRNPAPTAWTDTAGWKLELERTVAPPDDVADRSLGEATSLAATDDGTLYVMDTKPASIKVYGPDGAFVRSIGRAGAGPGEFEAGASLRLRHDTLVVHDRRNSRIVLFDTTGRHLGTARASAGFVMGLSTEGLLAIFAYLPEAPSATPPGEGVIRLRLDGTVHDSVFFPEAPLPKMWTLVDQQHDLGASVPFAPDRMQHFDPAGRLTWGQQDRLELVVARHGLDTARIIVLPAASTVPIPEAVRRHEFDTMAVERPWLKGVAKFEDVPLFYPAWLDFGFDEAGRLWLLRAADAAPGALWDVFDAEGVLLGRVPAPFRGVPNARTFWSGERVYRIAESAEGLPVIEVWRIRKK